MSASSSTDGRRTRSRSSRFLLGLAVLIGGARVAPAADVVNFYDGTFGGSWFSTKILDTTSGALATFTSTTTLADGVLPPCRETTHNWDSGAIVVAHVNTSANHDPSTGPICSISGSFDLVHATAPNGAVRYRMLISQGGAYYHETVGTDVFPNLWASYVVGPLTSASFTKVSGTGPDKPDFSCAGGLMTFGFTSSNSASSSGNTKTSSIDNWTLNVELARTTIQDGNFAGAWGSTKILDTTPGALATWSSLTQPVAGAPGAYREISHTFANGAIAVAHFDPAHVHDPSVMPVYEVSCSYTLRHFTPALGAVRFYLAIRQAGVVYVGPWDDVYPDAWTNFGHTGLLATDFTSYPSGFPVNPDFTATGSVFELGFVTSNSVSGGPVTKYAGIDNWTAVLEHSPRCTTATGSPYCFGDGTGPSCPCVATTGTSAPGRGCPNSLFPSGALLIGQGTASLANDTLQLRGSSMPNSSCLYFQGTAPTASVAFDGLRCAGGNVIRLGTKQNVCNASEYPDSADPSVSVRGQVLTPGTRYYQVWYRNAAAYCTSATANFTNGLQINWVP